MANDAPVAIVTGASEGIGRVIATHLVRSGYRVAAAARSTERLAELAELLGVLPITLDVTDAAAVADAFAAVEAEFGPVDLLVNNAGIGGHSGVTWEYDPTDWWRIVEVNLRGPYLCSRAVLPQMAARRSGRVVNVSSGVALFPIPEDFNAAVNSAYMASKAGINRMTEALAAEARPFAVSVFAISPGVVKTNLTRSTVTGEWDEHTPWAPPELAAELVVCIGSGALDAHSGRYLHAVTDNWKEMAGL